MITRIPTLPRLGALSLLLTAIVVHADPVELISNHISITGSYYESWNDGQEQSVTNNFAGEWFNDLSTHTLTRSTPLDFATASATVSSFNLDLGAWAAVSGMEFDDYTFHSAWIQLSVEAQTVFRPTGTELALFWLGYTNWDYSETGQSLRAVIVDLDTLGTVFDTGDISAGHSSGYEEFINDFVLSVDPSHRYQLALTGDIFVTDGTSTQLNLGFDIGASPGAGFVDTPTVPDAASTAGLVLAMLTLFRFVPAARRLR